MEANFSFFKAGQGLFYGGQIRNLKNKKDYSIVYDCGTTNFIKGNFKSLNNEIDNFKIKYSSKKIDLLFISHLDFDHVSGVKRLLKEFEVKKIILPYIKEEFRKYFLISFPRINNVMEYEFSIDEYGVFLEKPHEFIKQNSKYDKIKIIFIKSNEEKEVNYQNVDIYSENEDEDDIYTFGNFINEVDLYNENNIFLYENNLQFYINRYWEFTVYFKDLNEDNINNLNNDLKKLIGKGKNQVLTIEDLKNMLINNRESVKRIYCKHMININSHGLILLHGPINFRSVNMDTYIDSDLFIKCPFNSVCLGPYLNFKYSFEDKDIRYRTLLFGDTSINKHNNPVNFPKAFRDKLINVYAIQLPHHGSSKNWDYNEFKNLNIDSNKCISICNFGYGNRYGHPSHQILNDLNKNIILNSQFTGVNIYITCN
ncbi:MBL fold metallo-hydrolase [Acetoanaerobium noterae]|uniref:MBL fold metallo-hydrolase n=1 Tax=Acetoanaerobium noterae TaxID=745369 RepID=UPI0032217465